jgi:hypothetical protein
LKRRATTLFLATVTKNIKFKLSLLAGQFLGLSLLELCNPGKGLAAERGASPVLADFVSPFVEVGLHGLDQLVQRALILGLDLREEKNRKFNEALSPSK